MMDHSRKLNTLKKNPTKMVSRPAAAAAAPSSSSAAAAAAASRKVSSSSSSSSSSNKPKLSRPKKLPDLKRPTKSLKKLTGSKSKSTEAAAFVEAIAAAVSGENEDFIGENGGDFNMGDMLMGEEDGYGNDVQPPRPKTPAPPPVLPENAPAMPPANMARADIAPAFEAAAAAQCPSGLHIFNENGVRVAAVNSCYYQRELEDLICRSRNINADNHNNTQVSHTINLYSVCSLSPGRTANINMILAKGGKGFRNIFINSCQKKATPFCMPGRVAEAVLAHVIDQLARDTGSDGQFQPSASSATVHNIDISYKADCITLTKG